MWLFRFLLPIRIPCSSMYSCSFSTYIFASVFRSYLIIHMLKCCHEGKRGREKETDSLMQLHATIWIEHLTHVLCCVILSIGIGYIGKLVRLKCIALIVLNFTSFMAETEREIRHMYFGLLFAQGIYYLYYISWWHCKNQNNFMERNEKKWNKPNTKCGKRMHTNCASIIE